MNTSSPREGNLAPPPSGPYVAFHEMLAGPPLDASERAEELPRWAGILLGQGFARRQVRQILWQVVQRRCTPPPSPEEFEDLLSGRHAAARTDPVLAPGVNPDDADARREVLMQPESFPWTTLGNARRLLHMFGRQLRYATDEKHWLLWNGRFWEPDQGTAVRRLYRQMLDAMLVVASLIPPGRTPAEEGRLGRLRKEFIRWIHKSQARKMEQDAIEQARAEPGVTCTRDEFDRNVDLLTVANGTINLQTGGLQPHDPADQVTRFIDIEYDPTAACPVWRAFLLAAQHDDESMVDYLQRALGYSLTGDVREQCMFTCLGDGANGKTTMLETVMAVLGPYAATTDRNLLVLRRRDHPTSIYALRGLRLAVTSEGERDERLNEGLIKQLTGEREVQARGVGMNFDGIPITWKLWLTTNHPPQIRGTDFGIRRRIQVIPFDVRFEGNADDKTLAAKLMAERRGILAWLVTGCLAWRRDGLRPPEKVTDATTKLFDEQGRLGSFLSDCVRACPGGRMTGEQLYAFYTRWCERAGVPRHATLDPGAFGERMKARYTRTKSHGVMVYHGLEIPADVCQAMVNPGVPTAETHGPDAADPMERARPYMEPRMHGSGLGPVQGGFAGPRTGPLGGGSGHRPGSRRGSYQSRTNTLSVEPDLSALIAALRATRSAGPPSPPPAGGATVP